MSCKRTTTSCELLFCNLRSSKLHQLNSLRCVTVRTHPLCDSNNCSISAKILDLRYPLWDCEGKIRVRQLKLKRRRLAIDIIELWKLLSRIITRVVISHWFCYSRVTANSSIKLTRNAQNETRNWEDRVVHQTDI